MYSKMVTTLKRVHDFLGILVRESLVKEAPFLEDDPVCMASDLADDVHDAITTFRPRNCDVGTAEEQDKRFDDFCSNHKHSDGCKACKAYLPRNVPCAVNWMLLPYAEAEDGNE